MTVLYALAYGVNQGLLDRAHFMPIIEKGWKALADAVELDGKLGYVQPIGADPRKVTREMTEVYGVGAFLLAGCQIYLLDFMRMDAREVSLFTSDWEFKKGPFAAEAMKSASKSMAAGKGEQDYSVCSSG